MKKSIGWPWGLCALILLGFAVKQAVYICKTKGPHFTDYTSEQFAITGARNFIQDGGREHYFLPQYKGFITETPVKKVQETGVYTHFLPGPDYFVTFFLVWAESEEAALKWARAVAAFVLIFALGFLAWAVDVTLAKNFPWGKVFLLAALCTAPAIYRWGVSLFGHGLSSACILVAFGLGLLATEKKYTKSIYLWGFLTGFFSEWALLEGTFVTAAAPLVAGLLVTKDLKKTRSVAIGVCAGLVSAYAIHFLQVAAFLGSFQDAFLDQIGTALTRGEHRQGPGRWELVGSFSGWVREHFRIGSLPMLVAGIFFSWLLRPGLNVLAAILVAFLASMLFPLLLMHHSIIHSFRVPRLFLLEYLAFLSILILIFKGRIQYFASRR